jgi:hypothetical protein
MNIYQRELDYLKRTLVVEFNSHSKADTQPVLDQIKQMPFIKAASFQWAVNGCMTTEVHGSAAIEVDKQENVDSAIDTISKMPRVRAVNRHWNVR